jgi:hypothetical protein
MQSQQVPSAGLPWSARHGGLARLFPVPLADGADRIAHLPRVWRRRHHERQQCARALRLSPRPARPRHRDQRAGGSHIVGDRAERRSRNPVRRAVAMAIRDQCAARRHRSCADQGRTAADTGRPSPFRLAQRPTECGDVRNADHRHRQPSPALHFCRAGAFGCRGRRCSLCLAPAAVALPYAGRRPA